MATPTPTTWTQYDGSRGTVYWNALFVGATDFTDGVILDISTLSGTGTQSAPNSVRVTSVECTLDGDVTCLLEFDATTDQTIYQWQGQSDVTVVSIVDFTGGGKTKGRSPTPSATGFVGDILLTTLNTANLDEITLLIHFERKT